MGLLSKTMNEVWTLTGPLRIILQIEHSLVNCIKPTHSRRHFAHFPKSYYLDCSKLRICLTFSVVTSPKERGYVFTCVRLFVYLFACLFAKLKVMNEFWWIFWRVGRGQSSTRLHFGGDPDHDANPGSLNSDHVPDPGLLKAFFIYCCHS